MDTDVKPQEKKEREDTPALPRQIYTHPPPKERNCCKRCPYPSVGFICWSRDGTCLRTKMGRLGRPGR